MSKKMEYHGNPNGCKIELTGREIESLNIRLAEALCDQLFRDGLLTARENEAVHANAKKLEEELGKVKAGHCENKTTLC